MTIGAVSDAGPIIHLAEADALDTLSVVDRLYVPETVVREIEAGGTPREFDALAHDVVAPDSTRLGETDLDPGEVAALSVALERRRAPHRRPRCP